MKAKGIAAAVLAIAAFAVASPAASLAGDGSDRWSAGSLVKPCPINWS
jgi:hypothetical protein